MRGDLKDKAGIDEQVAHVETQRKLPAEKLPAHFPFAMDALGYSRHLPVVVLA